MPDLFAGAIGVFKNPLSHREVGNSDPIPVIEHLSLRKAVLQSPVNSQKAEDY
jgi:hypothetical protein